eukprot:TRINITY_DN22896_c0_g1_i1.p1 TRINITY_DN22896_c0_g1~~TRINITY_DN22896_c0_g1_i1.p1  ORF type:complete len:115 (+),score=19.53 TRINITY_DN22896_c0_g1_i1:220-564(+)
MLRTAHSAAAAATQGIGSRQREHIHPQGSAMWTKRTSGQLSSLLARIQATVDCPAPFAQMFAICQSSVITRGSSHLRGYSSCLLYTSDAADEEDSVDLGGRRLMKKKKHSSERC